MKQRNRKAESEKVEGKNVESGNVESGNVESGNVESKKAESRSGAGTGLDCNLDPGRPDANTAPPLSAHFNPGPHIGSNPGPAPGNMTCETAHRVIALAALGTPDLFQGDQALEGIPGGAFDTSFDADPPSDETAGEREGERENARGNDGMFAGVLRETRAAGSVFLRNHAAPQAARDADPEFAGFPEDPFASFETPQGPAAAAVRRQEQDALAAHLNGCRSCQAEMAATTAFFRALACEKGPEPSATLLARSRMQLDASLDSCAQHGCWTRITQQFVFTAGRLRAAPALSSALLLTGLLAGGYGGYQAGHAAHNVEQSTLLLAPPAPEVPSVVADVSSITRDNSTGLVEVRYDRLVPDVLTARADDPSIRELLMAATENGTDPQVRNQSVNLLSNSCSPGAACDGTPVRNALLNVLGSDKTPGVRREALAGLQPYIASDMEVRDAVLATLMNDPSASVRIEAVRLLEPVDVDSSVRQVLHTVAAEDGDPSIRSASLAALKTVPQVQ